MKNQLNSREEDPKEAEKRLLWNCYYKFAHKATTLILIKLLHKFIFKLA